MKERVHQLQEAGVVVEEVEEWEGQEACLGMVMGGQESMMFPRGRGGRGRGRSFRGRGRGNYNNAPAYVDDQYDGGYNQEPPMQGRGRGRGRGPRGRGRGFRSNGPIQSAATAGGFGLVV